MDRRRALLAGSLVVAIVALALLLVITRGESPKSAARVTASSDPATTAMPPPPIAPVSAKPVVASASAPPSGSASSVVEAMKDPDPFATRDAIAAAVENKDVSVLPTLATVDLSKNGYVAAAAISATGKLAAIAGEPARKDAVKTLDRWLKEESKRKANDAIANTSMIVDALHDTGSPDAIAPLVAALDAGDQPLHVETRIVQTLDAMDARSAAPSIEKFAARLRGQHPTDDLEKALTKEALDAAEATLAKWR